MCIHGFFQLCGPVTICFQVQSWASYDLLPLCYNNTTTQGEDPIGEDPSGDGAGVSIGEDSSVNGEDSGGLRSRTVTRDLHLDL